MAEGIDIHVVALSFRGIGARLSARPREHAARVRATTPESPSSLQAPTVPDSTEPHYGISGRIGEETPGPELWVNVRGNLSPNLRPRRLPAANAAGGDHIGEDGSRGCIAQEIGPEIGKHQGGAPSPRTWRMLSTRPMR